MHPELGHDLLVGALLLQRHELDQRLRADDDARGVDRVRPGEPFEWLRELQDLLRDRVRVDGLTQLRARAKRFGERLAGAFRDELRNAVDDAVGDVEHPARIANRRARRHRRERDDLGDPVASVLLGDVVDDLVAPGDREVDVHVRQVLARRVQEALEEQAVAQRVDVGDLEAVGGERTGRRAAPGADADPVLLGEVDEIPDDQEVVREAHLPDRLQLEAEPLVELGRGLAEALEQSLLAQLDQVVEGVATFRHRILREQDLAELDLDRAALRHLERACERMFVPGEVAGHLLGSLEEELVRVEAPVRGVLQRVARLDAEQGLVRVGVARVEVVDVSGRDERKARLLGERDQLGVDRLLLGKAGVLELDVGGVAPEDLLETVEVFARILRPFLGERPRHAPGETPGQRHEPLRVALQELPVDARLVVVPLEIPERAELDQVRVALVRLREERQVRVALGLRPPVVCDVHLAADDRLHALLAGLPVELDGAGERAVVGERDGRHLEPLRLLDERGDPAGPVEDRVFGVNVEVDEGRRGGVTHGRASLVRHSAGFARGPLARIPARPVYECVRSTASELLVAYAASPCQKASARRRHSSRRSARPVTCWSSQYARMRAPRSGSTPSARPTSSTRRYHDDGSIPSSAESASARSRWASVGRPGRSMPELSAPATGRLRRSPRTG